MYLEREEEEGGIEAIQNGEGREGEGEGAGRESFKRIRENIGLQTQAEKAPYNKKPESGASRSTQSKHPTKK